MKEYILNKIEKYKKGFNVNPDIIILSQTHLDELEDKEILKDLQVVVDDVKNPIIFKK